MFASYCFHYPENVPNRFQLVPDRTPPDVVEALEELCRQAKKGELIGIAFCAMYKRKAFIVDTAGECRRNPTFTRGMMRALDDRLATSVGSKPPPKVTP